MQIIVCLQLNSRNAQIEILSVYAWANLVETFGNILTLSINPATTSNQMVISYLYMMMQLLFTPTYTFKCCNSKLTDSGFGASDQFMLETQLLGKVW
jgi:hypothetical protein